MNPVIGLDIAKGESKGQAFVDKGKPHGKSFNVIHTREGLKQFHDVLLSVEELTGVPSTVESTGHYHIAIISFLTNKITCISWSIH